MPDTTSPKVTMADEDVRSLFGSEKDKTPSGRKWTCPEDEIIASYVDCTLGSARKKWVEFHLAGCRRCRLLIAGVLKAQREAEEDLPSVPPDLRWKSIGLVDRRSRSGRGIWVPAAALAAVALLAIGMSILRKPDQLIIQSPPSPAAPLIAKSEPSARLGAPVREIERKRISAKLLPRVVFPPAGSMVSRQRLQFSWKVIAQSRSYEVRVVTSEGDPVWQEQTEKSGLQPPSDLTVSDGPYFVWVTAYLEDGRVAKSPPVKFFVRH